MADQWWWWWWPAAATAEEKAGWRWSGLVWPAFGCANLRGWFGFSSAHKTPMPDAADSLGGGESGIRV